MPPVVLKPKSAQRTLWLTQWGIVTLLVLLPFLLPLFGDPGQAMAQMLIAVCVLWLVLALPTGVWIFFYYRSLNAEISADEIRLWKGVFTKKQVTVPIAQIASVDVSGGLFERLFGLQRLRIFSTEGGIGTRPALVLFGLTNAESISGMILGSGSSFADTLQAAEQTGEQADRATLETILSEIRALRKELNR